MATVLRALFSLAAAAVPLWGVLTADWTDGTGFALYWCESLISILFLSIRIALHHRWTRKQGHGFEPFVRQLEVGEKRVSREFHPGQFLNGFLVTSVSFTFVHGIFLFPLLVLMPREHKEAILDSGSMIQGLKYSGAILTAGFVWDLFTLRNRPFAWIRTETEAVLQRLGTTHFAILIGLFVMVFYHHGHPLLFTFAALRGLGDICGFLPAFDGMECPRWLMKQMTRIGHGDFAAYWRDEYADRQARYEEDELVIRADGPKKQRTRNREKRAASAA